MASMVGIDTDRQETSIHAWMRMRSPQLTGDMIEFLINGKGWIHLFDYISNVSQEDDKDIVREDIKFSSIDAIKRASVGHLEGIAQSWKATMIFAGKDIGGSEQNLISFFIPLERHFVVQLVKCFEPSSKACLNHACYILSRLIQKKPNDLFSILTMDGNKLLTELFPNLLLYTHHSSVASVLVDLICIPQPIGFVSRAYAPGDFLCSPKHICLLDKGLVEIDLLTLMLQPLFDSVSKSAESIGLGSIYDVLQRYLHRLSRSPHHEQVITYIKGVLYTLVVHLFRTYFNSHDGNEGEDVEAERREPHVVKLVCLDILTCFASSIFHEKIEGFKVHPYQSFATNIAPVINNKLFGVWCVLYDSIVLHLDEFAEKLVLNYDGKSDSDVFEDCSAVHHTTYAVDRPFTYLRMQELTFILMVIEKHRNEFSTHTLDEHDADRSNPTREDSPITQLPVEFFRLLCEWFFHYSHNNMYHNIFCRFLDALYFYKPAVKHIIETVILKRSSNVSQDNMEDFVTKAFNYYENADANTSSIGHIEQCLQLIYANDRDELINNVNFANAKQKCLILRNKILENASERQT